MAHIQPIRAKTEEDVQSMNVLPKTAEIVLSYQDREILMESFQSLFNLHPQACLVESSSRLWSYSSVVSK